ncbi:class I SAM-dependent methyltransferase [Humibacillus xanthopallidus]|uniref:class I SAM-dependent methyltransferase n=1 Tax=Humibacillus xanthopallidus TaxID=412689 RepID=UPI00384BE140
MTGAQTEAQAEAQQRRAGVADLFDQLAPLYDQSGVPWFGPIAQRLVALVGPQPGEHALDIGAGRGAATFPLREAVGATGHVTAVDLSPAMVGLLEREALERGVAGIYAIVGEAGPATLGAERFDVVTASLVLFFDPDAESTLRGWFELLRPRTGRLGITSFAGIDEHWAAAEAALLAHAPAGALDPRTTGTRGPFASSEALESLFRACGASQVETVVEPLLVTFPDAAAWRAWTMGFGLRQFWASVPESALPGVLAEIELALDGDRGDDGQLHLTQQVRYTTARAA